MKGKILLCMALVGLSFTAMVTSCSKDDDKGGDGASSIVGTWRNTPKSSEENTYTEWVFNSNKTGSKREVNDGEVNSGNETEITEWNVVGSDIIYKYRTKGSTANPSTTTVGFSLAGSELTLDGKIYQKR